MLIVKASPPCSNVLGAGLKLDNNTIKANMRKADNSVRRYAMKKTTASIRTVRAVVTLLILAPLLFAAARPGARGAERPDSGRLLKIGAISAENPTVSSLLLRNPKLKDDCWGIINAEPNRGKDYSRIQTGTEVYYDPATKELLWTDTASNTAPVAVMPETTFEFPPAVEGDKITHDFVIQNRGTADLTVLEVKTS